MDNNTHTSHRWILAIAVAVVLTALNLGYPGSGSSNHIRLIPFEGYVSAISCLLRNCGGASSALRFIVLNGLGNVVVFIPLGFAFARAFENVSPRPIIYALLAGILLSMAYELIQISIPGRVTALDDVILNSMGTLLGAAALRLPQYRSHGTGEE